MPRAVIYAAVQSGVCIVPATLRPARASSIGWLQRPWLRTKLRVVSRSRSDLDPDEQAIVCVVSAEPPA